MEINFDKRKDLINSSSFVLYTKPDPHSTLVPHVQWPAASPLGLNVAYLSSYSVVESIHKECDTNIVDFCNKRVSLLVWRMGFNLRENVGVAVVDNRF
jgi:hypothetical protein